MINSVAPDQGSRNWGPRAQQYFQTLDSNQQTGVLKTAQSPQDLREVFRGVRGEVERRAPADRTQDSLTLSPEALESLRER